MFLRVIWRLNPSLFIIYGTCWVHNHFVISFDVFVRNRWRACEQNCRIKMFFLTKLSSFFSFSLPSWRSRRSSSRGKRRAAPRAPQSRAGRKVGSGTDRSTTPAVELRAMFRQRGRRRPAGWAHIHRNTEYTLICGSQDFTDSLGLMGPEMPDYTAASLKKTKQKAAMLFEKIGHLSILFQWNCKK